MSESKGRINAPHLFEDTRVLMHKFTYFSLRGYKMKNGKMTANLRAAMDCGIFSKNDKNPVSLEPQWIQGFLKNGKCLH